MIKNLKNLLIKKSNKEIDEVITLESKELIKETGILDNHIEEKQEVKIIDKPKICCIDIEESDINKLKEQLKSYKQIKYSQLTGYSKDIICYDEAKEIDVEVYRTIGKSNY